MRYRLIVVCYRSALCEMTFAAVFVLSVAVIRAQPRLTFFLLLGGSPAGREHGDVFKTVAAAFAPKVTAERPLHIFRRPGELLAVCIKRVVFTTVAAARIPKVAGAAAKQNLLLSMQLRDLLVGGEKSTSAGFSLPVCFEHAVNAHKLIILKLRGLYARTTEAIKAHALRTRNHTSRRCLTAWTRQIGGVVASR